MDRIRLQPECLSCLIKKQIDNYPKEAGQKQKTEYIRRILRAAADAPETSSAPEVMRTINDIQSDMFGKEKDYSEIKRHFNQWMLSLEPALLGEIRRSEDPLEKAVVYAMAGNYIDFAAMEHIEEDKLRELFERVGKDTVNQAELASLKTDLTKADRLVYLTDNCGEIVCDKLLIQTIRGLNAKLDITVLVRGKPVVNDATMEDAQQTGLTDIAEVMGNGSSIAGTCLHKISQRAKQKIDGADIIISKGQGNFETLYHCGRNVYYIFMCKCRMFAERFDVPLYSGILVNDKKL